MKIAFDHQAFTWQSYGGMSRSFTILAHELSKLGQDVNIFAGIYRNHYLNQLPKDLVTGFPLKKYPLKSVKFFHYLNHFSMNRVIKAWKPNIIHETYYSFLTPLTYDCVRVATVYDMIHEIFPEMFKKDNPSTEWKKAALNRVDHIISISNSTKKDLIDIFGINEKKISVVHLCVDPSFAKLSQLEPIPLNTKPYILYVGVREGYKNFNQLLKSFSTSKNLMKDFNVIAFGGPKFSSAENKLMNDLGFLEGQIIHILGDDNLLGAYYSQARAFVYPSLYEGFGIPPLESMAYGCPVISSNTSSMPEVISDAAEFFDPTSCDDILRALEAVVYSESKIQILKNRGEKRLAHFSPQKFAQDTLSVYKSIL